MILRDLTDNPYEAFCRAAWLTIVAGVGLYTVALIVLRFIYW